MASRTSVDITTRPAKPRRLGLLHEVAEANGLAGVANVKEKISEIIIHATLVRVSLEAAIAGGRYAWGLARRSVPGLRIAGRSDEMQRNILAERVLVLPRELLPGPAGPRASTAGPNPMAGVGAIR